MKKPISTRKIILISSAIAAGTLGTSAGIATAIIIGKNNREKLPTYQVVFKNWDDTVLYTQTVKIGGTAVYAGPIPTRPTTEEEWIDYTFTGWDKPLKNILADTEIKAQFKGVKQQYTAEFYYDETSPTPLYTTTCDKGDKPDYKGTIPTKDPSGGKQYIFGGWRWVETWKTGQQKIYAIFNEAPEGLTIRDGVVVSYVGNQEEIVIPDVYGEQYVTSIAPYAFSSSSSVKKVIIPKSITTIGDYAFNGNTALETVEFNTGSKLTNIGNRAFFMCKALKSIALPDSLTSLSTKCFSGCSALESINLANVTEIATDAFDECTLLSNVSVNKDNTKFTTNDYAKGILFTKDETNEEYLTLYKCMPGVSNLDDLCKVPRLLTIGESAFMNCSKISKVDLSKSDVTNILDKAFAYSSIETFVSSDRIEYFTGACFKDCLSFKSFTLGKSVKEYGLTSDTFSGCTSLETLIVADGNEKFESDSGVLYWKGEDDTTWLIYCPPSIASIPEIKSNCVGFDSYAFSKNKTLPKVFTIPSSVVEIGNVCFNECNTLEKVTFDTNGTLIPGEQIFKNCNSLKEIHFNVSTSISMTANAASLSGCHALEKITVDSENPVLESIDDVLFTKKGGSLPFFLMRYPSARKDTDGNPITEYEIPEGVVGVARQSFDGSSSLKTITFPVSLKSVFDNAFNDCTALSKIILSSGYKYSSGSIKTTAFTGCTSLNNIVIKNMNDYMAPFIAFVSNNLPTKSQPLSVEFDLGDDSTISKNSFSGAWYLKSITLKQGIKSIGDIAFTNCNNLETVNIPRTLETIGGHAFDTCESLKQINFSTGLTSIGETAFGVCKSLESVRLESNTNLTSLASFAFGTCTSLQEVWLPGSLKAKWSIGKSAFDRCYSLTTVHYSGTKAELLTACGDAYSNAFTEKTRGLPINLICSDGIVVLD